MGQVTEATIAMYKNLLAQGEHINSTHSEEEQLVFAWEQNASLKERLGMAENRAEMLAEDIECLHMALDKAEVPRTDGDDGPVFSMFGRVLRFKETPSNAKEEEPK